MTADPSHLVIGAGPAGLAAAHALSVHRLPAVVLDQDAQVGGLSRTVSHRGFAFDLGGHRFFTKSPEVMDLWRATLGDDFLVRPRRSRIYYRGRFFHYPLRPLDALAGLGLADSLRVALSYAGARLRPQRPEDDFAAWVSNRFGPVLFRIFFQTYTEKVWGLPCSRISADWAAQRIRNLSLGRALLDSLGLGRDRRVASLIPRFHYPRYGPGQMYEALARNVAARGVDLRLGHRVTAVHHDRGRLTAVTARGPAGDVRLPALHCFSSMPLTELAAALRPAPPDAVLDAARALRYRSFLTVNLLLDAPAPLPDNWIYLHDPQVAAGRLQLYQNWSPHMVPPGRGSLSFEYFCFPGDHLWTAPDHHLVRLAAADLQRLRLPFAPRIADALVLRYPLAYPLYDSGYQQRLAVLRDWLAGFPNLHCIGRYGQFRYNNMDHSILTGLLAVRRLLGHPVDPWAVNADGDYLEESPAA